MKQIGFKFFLIGTAVLLLGFSCRPGPKSDLPVVPLTIDGHAIWVEVAHKPSTRMAGLMFRREMGADDGMLFVFPDRAPRAFWMKNTLIPLSIAFMDEKGAIENILEMPPQTEENFLSQGPAKYALEMNAGWFGRKGVKPGDRVEGLAQAPQAQD